MFSSISVGLMHQISALLLEPVSWALIFLWFFWFYEIGITIGERFVEINRLIKTNDTTIVLNLAKKN